MQKLLLAAAAAAVLAACGSATQAPASSAASASPSSSPSASAPAGPPHAQATLTGDAPLAGPLTVTDVSCNSPSFDGGQITADATDQVSGLLVRLKVSAGSVAVLLNMGAGATYVERDFSGTGVTNFGESTGAQIDSPLSDTTAAGIAKGTIGSLTHVTATLSCNGQTPGSGSFSLTGSIESGSLTQTLVASRVICTTSSVGVTDQAFGIGTVGSSRALMIVFTQTYQGKTYMSMDVSPEGSTKSSFLTSVPGTGSVTASTTSMHAAGTISEPAPPKDSVQITGDATCGSTITPG